MFSLLLGTLLVRSLLEVDLCDQLPNAMRQARQTAGAM
jgi:hypothetical protein